MRSFTAFANHASQTSIGFHFFSPRKRESMFLPALVCVSVCDHDNYTDCGRICTKFYEKVPRGKGKTKFVFRYDR